MLRTNARWGLRALGVAVTIATASTLGVSGALAGDPPARDGIRRIALAETAPAGAPGQVLYLQEVRIAPGAALPTHFHDGTQVASVRAGVLTYEIVSGSVEVTRRDGDAEILTGPTTITLRKGDALVETSTLVHYGSNEGKKPVVVLLAALLAESALLATPVEPDT